MISLLSHCKHPQPQIENVEAVGFLTPHYLTPLPQRRCNGLDLLEVLDSLADLEAQALLGDPAMGKYKEPLIGLFCITGFFFSIEKQSPTSIPYIESRKILQNINALQKPMDLAECCKKSLFQCQQQKWFVSMQIIEICYGYFLHTMFPFGPGGPSTPAIPFSEEICMDVQRIRCYNRKIKRIHLIS